MRPNASMCPTRLDALVVADKRTSVFSELSRGEHGQGGVHETAAASLI